MVSILSKSYRASLNGLLIATAVVSSAVTASAVNHAPAVGIANDIYATKNSPYSMSFPTLVSLSGASDADGDPLVLVISSLQNGSLTLNGSQVTAGATIGAGDTLTWTPPTNIFNTYVLAFQVKAFDSQAYSEGAAQISASIRGNNPPELSAIESLSRANLLNAHKNERYSLSFGSLKTASDLRDMDDDAAQFVIDSVVAGKIFIDGQPVASRTAFGPTNVLTWFPPTNTLGTISAFKVLGFDGVDVSATPVTVSIEVTDPTPRFVKGANQKVLRDDFGQWVSEWATGIGPDEYALHFETSNDNPALFSSEPEVSDDGTLTYLVAPSAFGVANVSVVLADDQGHRSAAQTFTITVSLVNYAPEFEIPEELTVAEDAGLQKISGFANNITAGEAENFQSVSFVTLPGNPALYSIKPTITSDGTLSFKTATNVFGDDLVTVTLKDSGTTANGGQNTTTKTFTLHISAVNDAPSLALKTVSLNEDSEATFDLNITDPDSPASDVTATISSIPNTFISAATVQQESGTWRLQLTPARNAFGKTSLNILVSDGNTSQLYPLAITINAVNDAPQFELSRSTVSQTVAGQLTIVTGFATSISPGAANETNQVVTFQLTTADPTFFATKPTMTSDGTLKFKVADNVIGSNLVTVVAADTGGVVNGGVNKSEAKSFYIVAPRNPFPELKGIYSGLFFEDGDVKHSSSGSLNVTVTDKGIFSGKLSIEGGTYSVSGQFFLTAETTATVLRPGKSPLKLNLSLSSSGLVGSISEGHWTSTLFADKLIYSLAKPAPQAGKFTLALGNRGVATVTISAAGAATGVINWIDGTTANLVSAVTQSGQIPVYNSLYAGTGSAVGWITLSNGSGTTDLTGELSHIRVSTLAGLGFTNNLSLTGGSYIAPALGRSVITAGSHFADLVDGGLISNLHISATLSANNVFTCSGSGLTLKVNVQSGLVTGSFIHPVSKLATPIKAVMMQKTSDCAGFFTTRDGNGSFQLE